MSQESNYVVELLNNSISPVESVRNEASSKIGQLELNSSFLATLLDIASSNNNELSKLSYIILKNSTCKISSLCKSNLTHPNVDYRNVLEHVKAKLFEIFTRTYSNNSTLLSKDFCILVRNICRHEFPLNWTGLYENIFNNLNLLSNQPDELKLFNITLLIYHIFKERLSMRLYKDRAITNQLVDQLFPYVSKFWALEFLGRWKLLESSQDMFSNFNELQLKTSVYLDSLILNFYSDFLKNVHKNADFLELLTNLFYKFVIISKLNGLGLDKTGLIRKNILRIIKGVSRVIERQPYAMVFVDFSIFLNQIFTFMVDSDWEELKHECVKLLIAIFTSNSMNNEKYVNIYFDQVERIPKVQTDLTPIASPRRMDSIDVKAVVYYDSYDSLVKSRNLSNQNEIDELMDQQLTFCFYRVLSSRGGFVPFLDMLRTSYLRLDAERLGEWSEDEYPTEQPSFNMAPTLISSMHINLVEVFNFVFSALLKFEDSDFFDYDTFLQLYTLCFREFYNFHTYKHFGAIIDLFSRLLELQPGQFTKLLGFRVSRILNLWCKKPLIAHETKSQILSFLLKCVCSESSSFKVQHLVPLYNLYSNTLDESMWTELFKSVKTDYIVYHLSEIVKVNVPIIRTRTIELICNICLEYEEDGHNLSLIVSIYNQLQSVEICEAIVKSIHEFISKLDWVNCYTGLHSLNKNFVLFVLEIINSTVERDPHDGSSIKNLSKYNLISELFLSMWLGFLRIVPLKLDDHLKQYFHLFGPLVSHLYGSEGFREDTLYSKLCVELLTEYLLILAAHMDYNKEYSINNVGDQVVFSNEFASFDLLKLYQMCAFLNDQVPLILSVWYPFGINESLSNQCLAIINEFFNSVETCGHSDQNSVYFSALSTADKATSLQPMRFKKDSLTTIETLLPLVNRIAFSTQLLGSFFSHKASRNLEVWINEVLLTLVNVANVLRSDPFLQLGCITLSCFIISEFTTVVHPFMRVEKRSEAFDALELGWDNVNIHENHRGIFIMCYLLRVLSSVSGNYRKRHLVISTEKVEGYAVPPSNRFEYVKNKSLTNSKCVDSENLFQDALAIVLRYVVEAARRLPAAYGGLLAAETNSLDPQLSQMLKIL